MNDRQTTIARAGSTIIHDAAAFAYSVAVVVVVVAVAAAFAVVDQSTYRRSARKLSDLVRPVTLLPMAPVGNVNISSKHKRWNSHIRQVQTITLELFG